MCIVSKVATIFELQVDHKNFCHEIFFTTAYSTGCDEVTKINESERQQNLWLYGQKNEQSCADGIVNA